MKITRPARAIMIIIICLGAVIFYKGLVDLLLRSRNKIALVEELAYSVGQEPA